MYYLGSGLVTGTSWCRLTGPHRLSYTVPQPVSPYAYGLCRLSSLVLGEDATLLLHLMQAGSSVRLHREHSVVIGGRHRSLKINLELVPN